MTIIDKLTDTFTEKRYCIKELEQAPNETANITTADCTKLDLNYAYCQLNFELHTLRHCNFHKLFDECDATFLLQVSMVSLICLQLSKR